MPEYTNLLDKHGCKYRAKIHECTASGEIVVENNEVFLLQNTQSGSKPTSGVKTYKYGWMVHKGDREGLRSEHVTEFELTDDHSIKFPIGTRVKVKSGLTGTFKFGGDYSSIPSQFGKIKSQHGWYASSNCNKVFVVWDDVKYPTRACTYSMLENELELSLEPELRDIPGIHKFKVKDLVRVKSGVSEFIYGGNAHNNITDYGIINNVQDFDRDKKCMRVNVIFDDSRHYDMSEDELEIRIAQTHPYIKGDTFKWKDKLWYVTDADSSGIISENETGHKNTFYNRELSGLIFVKHFDNEVMRIHPGMYLKIEKLVNWASYNNGLAPVSYVPKGSTIKVLEVGFLKALDRDPYRVFLFEYNEKRWAGALTKENIYTISSASAYILPAKVDLLSGPSIDWYVPGPGASLAYPDGLGLGEHVSHEYYEREMRDRRARDEAKALAMRESYGFGYNPLRAPSVHSSLVWEAPFYDREPVIKIDPSKDREKYFCGSDPFEKHVVPTKELEIKKEKKFSL